MEKAPDPELCDLLCAISNQLEFEKRIDNIMAELRELRNAFRTCITESISEATKRRLTQLTQEQGASDIPESEIKTIAPDAAGKSQ